MTDAPSTCTLFAGERRLVAGPLSLVAAAALAAPQDEGPVLVFDDATGRVVDLDLRGGAADVAARYAPAASPRARGRPRLGVAAREVTLLPRQWEWLAAQPGGASATLRKLVEAARRDVAGRTEAERKARQEAAYQFMAAMAGDLPGYEAALRALFADDRAGVETHTGNWPADVRDQALKLAWA